MDDKIIAALEKLSSVMRVGLWNIAKQERLSPTQIQVLQCLDNSPDLSQSLTGISKEFNCSKPTMSDTLTSLTKKKLISKTKQKDDRRRFSIGLTFLGRQTAKRVSARSNIVFEGLKKFPSDTKKNAGIFLVELIISLQRLGVITVARICFSCANFKRDKYPRSDKPHYCTLTKRQIAVSEFNINCKGYNGALQ